ncbi:MAG TPA: hypothetical protein VET30_06765, partial [Pseudoxanthomonas sp.]|nr:hypothetical protein [Pseudoxanthomonas sp.]
MIDHLTNNNPSRLGDPMTLANELAAFKENFIARAPADRAQLIQKYIEESRNSHVATHSLREGDHA